MLTRIYIDNFRSFVNFEFRPERYQLLFGANGSGKSSLLDAIRSVKAFVRGGENPFTESTRTRWMAKSTQTIEIESKLRGDVYIYRVEFRLAIDAKRQSVNLERLEVNGAPVFELKDQKISFYSNYSLEPVVLDWETTESGLHLSQFSNQSVRQFVEWMDTVHCFQIDSYAGKMEEIAENEARHPDFELENLASWYRYLVQEFPEQNVALIHSLREALNGFQTLRLSTGNGETLRRLKANFLGPGEEPLSYSISELSEGQRCIIGLYMIVHFLLERRETVFIDEPDNFLALREIQPWLLLAQEMTEEHGAQLVIISHHPEILNQWAASNGLRFYREDGGHVRTEELRLWGGDSLTPAELISRGWENA